MSNNSKVKYTVENNRLDALVNIVLGLTLFPWIVMLATGALGHRLDIPFLTGIGFLDSLLISIAATPFRGGEFTKKVIKVHG